MSARKMLISEVEDSMRRQYLDRYVELASVWKVLRQAYIDTAAWLILQVEAGDNAAEEGAQDAEAASSS
jgi:hypothetical protein